MLQLEPTTEADVTQLSWKSLCAHLDHWFEAPDTESLEVTLSAITAHYGLPGADPVWIMDVRVPGSGKTAITCEAVRLLPQAHLIGDLTPKTFISHYGSKDSGLLKDIGRSGILVMKDFTTFLSKRPDHRAELVAQLREIYDGRFTKRTGAAEVTLWEGKVTVIAGCTPAVERAWSVMRDLGDRFLVVRSPRIGLAAASKASHQINHEQEISRGIRELALGTISPTKLPRPPYFADELQVGIHRIGEVTAMLRSHTHRGENSNKITEIDYPEEPTRIGKALTTLCIGHAMLFRHPEVTEDDVRIAHRVASNSIPPARLAILRGFPVSGDASEADVRKLARLYPAVFSRALDDLEAIGVVEKFQDSAGFPCCRYSPMYRELVGVR